MLERAKSYRKLAEKAYRKLVDERAARLRTLTRSMAGRLGNLPDVGDATLDRAQWSCRPFWQPFFLRSRPSGAHSSAMSFNMVAASVSPAAAASLAQSADRSRNHSTFKFTSTLRMTRLHQRGCHDSDPKSFSGRAGSATGSREVLRLASPARLRVCFVPSSQCQAARHAAATGRACRARLRRAAQAAASPGPALWYWSSAERTRIRD